jgi:hypothetical protein
MDLGNDDRIPKLIEQMQRETDARKISALMTELLAALDEKRASTRSSGKSDRRLAS